jgi:hypothetical protein
MFSITYTPICEITENAYWSNGVKAALNQAENECFGYFPAGSRLPIGGTRS